MRRRRRAGRRRVLDQQLRHCGADRGKDERLDRKLDPGVDAGVGRELFRISQNNIVRVFVTVPEEFSKEVRPGTKASMDVTALPSRNSPTLQVAPARRSSNSSADDSAKELRNLSIAGTLLRRMSRRMLA